ncbi:MAG: GNAT family N-acetyltransferase [Bacteroidales bacterium]
MGPILHGNQFILRPLKYSDAEALARHANDAEVARFLRPSFPHPYFLYDAQKFIRWVQENEDQYILAIEVEGEASGAIGIHRTFMLRRQVWEVGYWLGQAHWNKKIMTEALGKMLEYYVPALRIKEIYASIYEPNMASSKVLQKCGFTLLSSLNGVMIRDGSQVTEQVWIKRF